MCRVIDPVRTGQRLQKLCQERGLTPKDIMRLLNLSDRRCIYFWFSGENLPSIDNLYMLAGILNIPMDDILVAQSDISQGDERHEF